MAKTPLIITVYCIFKLQFHLKCKMLPIFVWKREKYLMYQFSSPFLAKCTGFIPHPPSRRIMEEYIPLTWRWHAFLAFLFFVYVARRRTSSYGVARLVQIAPLNCWRNSTPFWYKSSFCTVKIVHLEYNVLCRILWFLRIFHVVGD